MSSVFDSPYWTALLICHLFGVCVALLALLYTRTPQGALAWLVSLIVVPYIAIPLYLILGPRKFDGYIEARRARKSPSSRLAELTARVLAMLQSVKCSEGCRQELFPLLKKLVSFSLCRGNDCTVHMDGVRAFPEIYKKLCDAKQYILIEFFIIKNDKAGRQLQKMLIEKARQGVRVYVVYDEIGCRKLPPGYVSQLKKAGVRMEPFNGQRFFLRNIVRLNFRNHRKLVLVDGHTCFIGGMNVGDEYMGEGHLGYWRDTLVELSGPCVLQAQLSFVENWHWATGGEIPKLSWELQMDTQDKALLILPSGPADTFCTWQASLVAMANAARNRLWIATPYFVPDTAVLAALQNAALRGVDVRILKPEKPDHLLVHLSSYTMLQDSIPYGISVHNYTKGFMHQKVVLVDDDVFSVGTANLDNRSLVLNFEISVIGCNRETASQVAAMLEEDFRNSTPLTLREYEEKSLFFHIACHIARLLAPIQ